MPISQLLLAMDPPAATTAVVAAQDLRYRDFVTVALVVPLEYSFPRQLDLRALQRGSGRSHPELRFVVAVHGQRGTDLLGLEFFVFEGDETWNRSDADLIAQGKRELGILGLVDPSKSRGRLRRPHAEGVPVLRRTLQSQRGPDRRMVGGLRSQRPSRRAATACTGTTTRTTPCTRPCSRPRTSPGAPTTTSGGQRRRGVPRGVVRHRLRPRSGDVRDRS